MTNVNKHLVFSLIKSLFRIYAGITIIHYRFLQTGILLIIAETFGIIEEMVVSSNEKGINSVQIQREHVGREYGVGGAILTSRERYRNRGGSDKRY